MDALTGEWCGAETNILSVNGEDISQRGPAERRLKGLCFVPEERNGHAAVPGMRLSENALLTSFERENAVNMGIVQYWLCGRFADEIATMFDVRRPEQDPLASSLSGGNLQKFVVGREIAKKPKLLIVSQPTWGVDGAAQFIRKAMIELAAGGASVIVISQDLEEIFAVSHKIAVLHEGDYRLPIPAAEMNPQKIGLLMGGSSQDTAKKQARGKAGENSKRGG